MRINRRFGGPDEFEREVVLAGTNDSYAEYGAVEVIGDGAGVCGDLVDMSVGEDAVEIIGLVGLGGGLDEDGGVAGGEEHVNNCILQGNFLWGN